MSGALTDSPAVIVRKSLIDGGLAVLPTVGALDDWQAFEELLVDKPDKAISVHTTESRMQGDEMIDGELSEHFGVQIVVRGVDQDSARTKAQAIAIFLDKTIRNTTVVIGAVTYTLHAVTRTSAIFPLGPDAPQSRRRLLSINAVAAISQQP